MRASTQKTVSHTAEINRVAIVTQQSVLLSGLHCSTLLYTVMSQETEQPTWQLHEVIMLQLILSLTSHPLLAAQSPVDATVL